MSDLVWQFHDDGRVIINAAFSPLLTALSLTTFDRIWQFTNQADVAKNVRTDRVTLRFTLEYQGHLHTFYIKRHGRSSLKEYLKPLFSLRWPILGARNEWQALIEFHKVGIPTMTPVALGHRGSRSFLITAALEACTKLSDLHRTGVAGVDRRALIDLVAATARQMHGAGLHHQDFYLGHLLLPNASLEGQAPLDRLYVIDLGRVRHQRTLSRRWIVKDLAQLNYSATGVSQRDQLRFLRAYLGRDLQRDDRRLMTQIASKTAAIARHSRKNRL